MKYVVVTGGVISGLGKGITISSLGALLRAGGQVVTSIKIDPYLNVDAGTLSPMEHGECFVLDCGSEGDLDLGNYERFLDVHLTGEHNITTGKVYSKVLADERKGKYLGKTVQVIPHVTNAVQDWIERVAAIPVNRGSSGKKPNVCLIEIGGTVGDMESMLFLEAIRQLQFRVGRKTIVYIHVSLVPVLGNGEQKSKPTQHSVRQLRSMGINPDILVCRSPKVLEQGVKDKLAMHCQVDPAHLLSVADVPNIYHVPLLLHAQGAHTILDNLLGLGLPSSLPGLTAWQGLANRVDEVSQELRIVLVGKYTGLQDSYLSVIKALQHSAVECGRKLKIQWVESENIEGNTVPKAQQEEAWTKIKTAHGILVPGGFGVRGVDGKVAAIQYAREHKVPFLGICLGMQCAVIEYARHKLGWDDANSTEFDKDTKKPVVVIMSEIDPRYMGGTMRLGAKETVVTTAVNGEETLASKVYGGKSVIMERHRHRYEVNPEHVQALTEAGLMFTGRDKSGKRMEILELPQSEHPFFFASQYHPEFLTRPMEPAAPFHAFVATASGLPMPGTTTSALDATAELQPASSPDNTTQKTSNSPPPLTSEPAVGSGGGAGAGAGAGAGGDAALAASNKKALGSPRTPTAVAHHHVRPEAQ